MASFVRISPLRARTAAHSIEWKRARHFSSQVFSCFRVQTTTSDIARKPFNILRKHAPHKLREEELLKALPNPDSIRLNHAGEGTSNPVTCSELLTYEGPCAARQPAI